MWSELDESYSGLEWSYVNSELNFELLHDDDEILIEINIHSRLCI